MLVRSMPLSLAFRQPHRSYIGQEQANILEGEVPDTPLYVDDKQIFAVRIPNAVVEGNTGVLANFSISSSPFVIMLYIKCAIPI